MRGPRVFRVGPSERVNRHEATDGTKQGGPERTKDQPTNGPKDQGTESERTRSCSLADRFRVVSTSAGFRTARPGSSGKHLDSSPSAPSSKPASFRTAFGGKVLGRFRGWPPRLHQGGVSRVPWSFLARSQAVRLRPPWERGYFHSPKLSLPALTGAPALFALGGLLLAGGTRAGALGDVVGPRFDAHA